MICSNEFAFFLQVLQKSGIGSREFALPAEGDLEIDAGLRRQLGVEPSVFAGCRVFFPHMEAGAVYHVTDCFYLHYLFFLLPDAPRCMVVGPYLSMRPSARQILETAERHDLPPARAHLLEEFYAPLPQIADNSSFYALVYCLCETLCGRQVQVRPISLNEEIAPASFSAASREADLPAAIALADRLLGKADSPITVIPDGVSVIVRK